MLTFRITSGPTRIEQLWEYAFESTELTVTLENDTEVTITSINLDLGHTFSGQLLVEGEICRVAGQYDPYSQTGELQILGPHASPKN